MIGKLIKSIFCKHEYITYRNIHGDEINQANGNRRWMICKKCDKFKLGKSLDYDFKVRLK